jgi:hypothetical protein
MNSSDQEAVKDDFLALTAAGNLVHGKLANVTRPALNEPITKATAYLDKLDAIITKQDAGAYTEDELAYEGRLDDKDMTFGTLLTAVQNLYVVLLAVEDHLIAGLDKEWLSEQFPWFL